MAEQPSLGGAIALQGRNTIAEQLGKMQFQMGQKEADRLAKKGLEDAKRIAEIEQKFAIPKGQYHRLVLPEIQKTQAVYLDKVKDYSVKVFEKAFDEIGKIIAARVVQKADDLTIITANGVAIRIKNKDVRQAGRSTKGVHLIKPQPGDSVASVARIAAEDLKKAGAQLNGDEKVEEPQPQMI